MFISLLEHPAGHYHPVNHGCGINCLTGTICEDLNRLELHLVGESYHTLFMWPNFWEIFLGDPVNRYYTDKSRIEQKWLISDVDIADDDLTPSSRSLLRFQIQFIPIKAHNSQVCCVFGNTRFVWYILLRPDEANVIWVSHRCKGRNKKLEILGISPK